jgi:hypothetical protein
MRTGIGIGITRRRRSGGGGADTTPPEITNVAADPEDGVSFDLSEPGTVYMLRNTSATPLTGAAIKAGAEDDWPAVEGANDLEIDDSAWDPDTYYLHFAAEDAAGNITPFGSVVEWVVADPGVTFTEDWSGFTAGDDNTDIDAGGYLLSASPPTCTIVSDASAPDGKALHMTAIAASVRHIARDDIATALAAGGWTYVEVLVMFRTSAASGARGAVGFADSSSVASGLIIQRAGGGINLGLSTNLDPNSAVEQSLGTGIADDLIYWARLQFEGTNLRGRVWLNGAGEPGTYGSDVTSSLNFSTGMTRLDLIGRTTTATNLKILGYSVGIDTGAPAF